MIVRSNLHSLAVNNFATLKRGVLDIAAVDNKALRADPIFALGAERDLERLRKFIIICRPSDRAGSIACKSDNVGHCRPIETDGDCR